MPDKGVTANGLVVLDGKVDEVIGPGPVVLPLGVLYALPLHAVLGGELAEVGLDDGGVLARGEAVLVGTGAKVQLAFRLHQLVDTCCGLARLNLIAGWCSQRRKGRQQE